MLKQLLKKPATVTPATIDLESFSAEVKYSARRKTLTIKVINGAVVVQAPVFASQREIVQFLRLKSAWIQQKIAEQQVHLAARQRQWCSGEYLPFLGDRIQLRVEPGSKGPLTLDGNILRVPVRASLAGAAMEARVQKLVQQWYKQQAAADINVRLKYWQTVTGIKATASSVKTYKARWGSCNHRAEVSFNWKLVMAPPEVIDYVVVHELCHIIHFNHSPAYWRLVAQYQPNYKNHKTWLKSNGLSLEL